MTKLAIYPSIKLTGETEIQKNKSQTITRCANKKYSFIISTHASVPDSFSFVTDIVLIVCSNYSLIIALEKRF